MLFIIDNANNFQTGLEIYGLHTRSKNKLFVTIAKLSSVQKGITYSGIKIFGARGGVVVKALHYKPAGRGFDSQWSHWNFSVT